jgi:precorrin-2 dehydrogenase/sirohydrochlorin ferrochelatase
LLDCGAKVSLVWPGFPPSFGALRAKGAVFARRAFRLADLRGRFLVIFCPKDKPALIRRVARACRKEGALLCAIDQPSHCDVVNGAVYQKGRLKIAISTGGAAPSVAKKIRQGLEASLASSPIDKYVEALGGLRERLGKASLSSEERMRRLIGATKGFSFRAKAIVPRMMIR